MFRHLLLTNDQIDKVKVIALKKNIEKITLMWRYLVVPTNTWFDNLAKRGKGALLTLSSSAPVFPNLRKAGSYCKISFGQNCWIQTGFGSYLYIHLKMVLHT